VEERENKIKNKRGREKEDWSTSRLFPKDCSLKKLGRAGILNIAHPSKSLLLTHTDTKRKEKPGLIRSHD